MEGEKRDNLWKVTAKESRFVAQVAERASFRYTDLLKLRCDIGLLTFFKFEVGRLQHKNVESHVLLRRLLKGLHFTK